MSEKMSFEQNMMRLNEIVRGLERGDTALSESLAMFQEGAALVAKCQKELDEAQQVVVRLRKTADGTPEELPFIEE